MKILIQIGHPAQFHFYKNAVTEWQKRGHKVRLLIRKKDVLEKLVATSGFDYVNIEGKIYNKSSKIELIKLIFSRFYRLLYQVISFRPHVVISPDPILAKICRFSTAKFIAVSEDDYSVIKTLADLLFPSSDHILAPQVCDFSKWQHKKIGYAGYMKLAYLHPNRFRPQKSFVENNINAEKYILIRLVSLVAHHDEGVKGINNNLLDRLIEIFESKGYVVFISSEKELQDKYKCYKLNTAVEVIHHVMAFASFVICDSQSMAVEAAMLGVPSIRFNDFAGKISVLEELEHKHGLTYGIQTSEPEKLYEKIEELLAIPNLQEEFQARRQRMLADKIDVTAFLVWFIENYPKSAEIMQETPDYQLKFK
ncbi:MAG TPA: DUF354 domain-containing protein [Bacteroidales bacterium]|nr:DUF354 domain-containing protein [Bacteroidales bacterium]